MWSRCVSASSSGFPENSGLKWDQFKCTIGCAGCCGACSTAGCCGACSTAGCCDTCGTTWSAGVRGGLGAGTFCGYGPGSAISNLYLAYVQF